ncbi:hypothetical protein ACWGJ2_29735 [Streptomyces sp. NPDC054796]
MTRSSTRSRSTAVVLVGLLVALCALLTPKASATGSSGQGASGAVASGAVTSGAVASETSGAAGSAGTAVLADGADKAPHDPGAPGCHRSQGGDGSLPATRGGAPQSQPLVLSECPLPASHSALDAAHARPPVRGPSPLAPPTPVGLSVLRV